MNPVSDRYCSRLLSPSNRYNLAVALDDIGIEATADAFVYLRTYCPPNPLAGALRKVAADAPSPIVLLVAVQQQEINYECADAAILHSVSSVHRVH